MRLNQLQDHLGKIAQITLPPPFGIFFSLDDMAGSFHTPEAKKTMKKIDQDSCCRSNQSKTLCKTRQQSGFGLP